MSVKKDVKMPVQGGCVLLHCSVFTALSCCSIVLLAWL